MPVPPKKNSAFTFYLGLISQATGLLQANPTLAAGDVKIAIDDGAPANLATLPVVDADFTKRVKVVLSAAEMNGDNISLIFSDQAGAEWSDALLNIQTSTATIDDITTLIAASVLAAAATVTIPSLDNEIRDFVVGDDFNVERDILNVPVGATLTKAWFTVKISEDDLDATAVFQLDITSAYVAGKGQITDNGADQSGHVSFEVLATDSIKLTGNQLYRYDIQVLTSTGKLYTPEKGSIMGRKQVTRATS